MYAGVPDVYTPCVLQGYQLPMAHSYDILWMTEKGLHWIEAVSDLETAKAKVYERLKENPGRYLIFNQMTQEKITIEPD
jgi:hypothetical protein